MKTSVPSSATWTICLMSMLCSTIPKSDSILYHKTCIILPMYIPTSFQWLYHSLLLDKKSVNKFCLVSMLYKVQYHHLYHKTCIISTYLCTYHMNQFKSSICHRSIIISWQEVFVWQFGKKILLIKPPVCHLAIWCWLDQWRGTNHTCIIYAHGHTYQNNPQEMNTDVLSYINVFGIIILNWEFLRSNWELRLQLRK